MPPTTLPSATPTVLIIGAGGIGERHVRCFLATARTGVALCEPNVDRRKLICERYGVAGFATAAEALATARFRAAVICTPAPRHPAIAAECLAAGLSVLIEKPLAASHEGLDSLRQALARSQGILRVAYVYRSIPVIQACRELVQSETLGKVRHVTVEAGQNFPSFRPDFQRTYYAKRASGGGAIQDFLTHMVHGVEWTVGPVVELACLADRQVLSGVEVEDVASLLCRIAMAPSALFRSINFRRQTKSPSPTTRRAARSAWNSTGSVWAWPAKARPTGNGGKFPMGSATRCSLLRRIHFSMPAKESPTSFAVSTTQCKPWRSTFARSPRMIPGSLSVSPHEPA